MSLRNMLRVHTGDCHVEVDRIFGSFILGDENGYRSFLTAHARILPGIEISLEKAGVATLLSDWPQRSRRAMLDADRAALGVPAPPPLIVPVFGSEEEIWGAVYVLEGSKLGGSILAKRLPGAFPSAYLGYQGPKGAQKAFMQRLDRLVLADFDKAVAAARSVFDTFRKAGELELELAQP
jgi:heme oxygenase (biliverdin-IX-beta and delta-forming)